MVLDRVTAADRITTNRTSVTLNFLINNTVASVLRSRTKSRRSWQAHTSLGNPSEHVSDIEIYGYPCVPQRVKGGKWKMHCSLQNGAVVRAWVCPRQTRCHGKWVRIYISVNAFLCYIILLVSFQLVISSSLQNSVRMRL